MICCITGSFATGKDLVADLLLKTCLEHNDCIKAQKILSYTTRPQRYEGENTHIFCTKQEFQNLHNFIATTKIDGHFYGAVEEQFDPQKLNIYVVDGKGTMDVLNSGFDDVFVVQVTRPRELIEVSLDRINRIPNGHYDYPVDYRILNNNSLEDLKVSVGELYSFLLKRIK